jgi:hypothetical protein
MSLTLHDDIISVYISVSVYQQMSLIRDDAQNDNVRKSTSYGSVLGTFIKTLKFKVSFFFQI